MNGKRPYWATRKTWPRGRSCSDNSYIRTYWFRSVLWSADDRAKLAQEIEQEMEYRRRHEAMMERYANLDFIPTRFGEFKSVVYSET